MTPPLSLADALPILQRMQRNLQQHARMTTGGETVRASLQSRADALEVAISAIRAQQDQQQAQQQQSREPNAPPREPL